MKEHIVSVYVSRASNGETLGDAIARRLNEEPAGRWRLVAILPVSDSRADVIIANRARARRMDGPHD